MAVLEVRVDASTAITLLQFGSKRLRYAVANAINATAKRVQLAERAHVRQAFTVRRAAFIEREAAIIKPFASGAGQLSATISVGRKPRLFLGAFERGGERRAQRAIRGTLLGVAVPVTGGARPSTRAIVPEPFWTSRLRLRRQRGGPRRRAQGSGRAPVYQGEQATFAIPEKGIFQRIGAGMVRALYVIARGVVRLDARLRFVDIGRQVVGQHYRAAVLREVDDVLRRRGLR